MSLMSFSNEAESNLEYLSLQLSETDLFSTVKDALIQIDETPDEYSTGKFCADPPQAWSDWFGDFLVWIEPKHSDGETVAITFRYIERSEGEGFDSHVMTIRWS